MPNDVRTSKNTLGMIYGKKEKKEDIFKKFKKKHDVNRAKLSSDFQSGKAIVK